MIGGAKVGPLVPSYGSTQGSGQRLRAKHPRCRPEVLEKYGGRSGGSRGILQTAEKQACEREQRMWGECSSNDWSSGVLSGQQSVGWGGGGEMQQVGI